MHLKLILSLLHFLLHNLCREFNCQILSVFRKFIILGEAISLHLSSHSFIVDIQIPDPRVPTNIANVGKIFLLHLLKNLLFLVTESVDDSIKIDLHDLHPAHPEKC